MTFSMASKLLTLPVPYLMPPETGASMVIALEATVGPKILGAHVDHISKTEALLTPNKGGHPGITNQLVARAAEVRVIRIVLEACVMGAKCQAITFVIVNSIPKRA